MMLHTLKNLCLYVQVCDTLSKGDAPHVIYLKKNFSDYYFTFYK